MASGPRDPREVPSSPPFAGTADGFGVPAFSCYDPPQPSLLVSFKGTPGFIPSFPTYRTCMGKLPPTACQRKGVRASPSTSRVWSVSSRQTPGRCQAMFFSFVCVVCLLVSFSVCLLLSLFCLFVGFFVWFVFLFVRLFFFLCLLFVCFFSAFRLKCPPSNHKSQLISLNDVENMGKLGPNSAAEFVGARPEWLGRKGIRRQQRQALFGVWLTVFTLSEMVGATKKQGQSHLWRRPFLGQTQMDPQVGLGFRSSMFWLVGLLVFVCLSDSGCVVTACVCVCWLSWWGGGVWCMFGRTLLFRGVGGVGGVWICGGGNHLNVWVLNSL